MNRRVSASTRGQSVERPTARRRVLQLTAIVIAGGLVAWLGLMPSSSQGAAAVTARLVPPGVTATPAVTANVHTNPAIAPAAVETYFYNFENGTTDWQLQTDFWSLAASEGGHALRGAGNGFARLTAHTGEISSLRFRFRLQDLQSRAQANVLETFATGIHVRYFVDFGTQGVAIGRQAPIPVRISV